MKLIFLSAVSGAGKSDTCQYIKKHNMLSNYAIFDIDDLENINNYDSKSYIKFYENAINNALLKSDGKDILIASCINPSDISKIKLPKEVKYIEMVLLTCSNNELTTRLKSRDKERNCSSDEFINSQINYQDYLIKNLDKYKIHIDNTCASISDVANMIVNYLNNK